MKILITGATGFIGQHLVTALKKEGHIISCLIRIEANSELLSAQGVSIQEISDDEVLQAFFEKEKFDIIIHLATLYLVTHTVNDIDPLVDANIRFGLKILEFAKISGVKTFINTSSFIQNYEGKEYSPVNLYAAMKQAFEDLGRYYGESGFLNFISLSLVNSYGPGDTRKKIFNIWKEALEIGNRIQATSGEQYIDILYITDVIDAFLVLVKQVESQGNQYNLKRFTIGSSNVIKLKELSHIFEEVVGKKLDIDWGSLPHRGREIMYPYNRGELLPNWSPKIDIKTGIKLFLNC